MLIKITSLIGAIIASGALSRVIFYVFLKNNKNISTILIINILSFIILMCAGTYLFNDVEIFNNIIRSTLLFIAPLFIWITADTASLNSSNDKKLKILNFEFSLISFLVLFSVIVSISAIYYYPTEKEHASRQFRDEVHSLLESTNDSNGIPTKAKLLGESPIMEGESGEIEKFYREIINASVKSSSEYQRELHIAETHLLLDPSRLRGMTNKAHTQKILNDTLSVIAKYASNDEVLFDQVKSSFQNLNIDQREKELIAYDFKKSISKSVEISKEVWEMEKTAVTKIAEAATWLGENNDAWIFENDQYLFHQDGDIDIFNKYILEINEIVSKQAEIQEQVMKSLNKGLNAIK